MSKRILCLLIMLIISLGIALFIYQRNRNSFLVYKTTPVYTAYDNEPNVIHKSNLDYIAIDDNPNDSVFYFYRIKRADDEKHYRFEIVIDIDKNTISVSRAYYYNEWLAFEGGRITKNIICNSAPIEWEEDKKINGYSDFSKAEYGRDIQVLITFSKNELLITQVGTDDYFDLSGTYLGAQ